ncbi:MAG: hypothetical protein ACP5UB_12430 [Candidatus Sumerlaeaceae bacterium]
MLKQSNANFALVPLLCFFLATGTAQTVFFAFQGKLISFDGEKARVSTPRMLTGETPRIHRVWGSCQGKVVATLEKTAQPKDAGTSGSTPNESHDLALLAADGSVEKLIAANVARAFPSPTGNELAYVTAGRRCLIYREDSTTPLALEGRVSHLAWSPDSARLAIVLYPEDWSAAAVNNAPTTADFFRLQTSKIVLLDAISLAPLATIVENDGTNFNPFFSPDGATLYYIHLDLTDDVGGVRELALADAGKTSGKLVIPTGERQGGLPLGRVGTYLWVGDKLLFEAGTPEGEGVLWLIAPDGTAAKRFANGRYPQPLAAGRVAFLKPDGTPAVLDIDRKEDTGK